MSTQRKFWIAAGALCLIACCCAILTGCWFGLHHRREDAIYCLIVALVAFWLGHCIACALDKSPGK